MSTVGARSDEPALAPLAQTSEMKGAGPEGVFVSEASEWLEGRAKRVLRRTRAK